MRLAMLLQSSGEVWDDKNHELTTASCELRVLRPLRHYVSFVADRAEQALVPLTTCGLSDVTNDVRLPLQLVS